jgi:hypothetical protein
MSLTLHHDIISVYISVSVDQQISLTLHHDIISVCISISVYQQMSLTLNDDILMVSEKRTGYDRQITGRCSSFCLHEF